MSDDRDGPRSESAPATSGSVISGKSLSDDELVPQDLGLSPTERQEVLRRVRAYHENPETAIPYLVLYSIRENHPFYVRIAA